MKRALSIAAVLVGCSSTTTQTPVATPAPAPATASGASAPAELTPASYCAALERLDDTGCLEDEGEFDVSLCEVDVGKSLSGERGPEAVTASTAVGRCLLDHDGCDEVFDCIDAATATNENYRACADVNQGEAVGWPQADWERRKGAGVTRFSAVDATKAAPIEVCGVEAQRAWLVAATCDDGSHPYASAQAAAAARVGNVGTGGRCGAFVDVWEVACPESTYEVHIDMYSCPLPADDAD